MEHLLNTAGPLVVALILFIGAAWRALTSRAVVMGWYYQERVEADRARIDALQKRLDRANDLALGAVGAAEKLADTRDGH